MLARSESYPEPVQPGPLSSTHGIPNDVLRRASAIAPGGLPKNNADSFLSPPRTVGIWPVVSCTWALLAGARVLFYALERARYPDIMPPVTADAIEGVLLWPCVLLGCWGALAVWRRGGAAMAAGVAISGAFLFGTLSRLAYGVGTLFNAADPSSGRWLSLFNSTKPGFLLPWMSNTVEYAVLYLSCLGLSVGYLSYNSLKEERYRHRRAEVLATTERLRALRTQLNPHFLFNSLNSIVGMSVNSPDAARRLTTQLGDLMRRTLRASETEWHSLDEEMAYAAEFLRLQELRRPSQLVWRIKVDAPGSLEVPTLVTLPLIENAVVHGNATGDQPIHIDIKASVTGTTIVMEVTNTVASGRRVGSRRGMGMGLRNLADRLTILFGSTATLATDRSDARRWRTTITCAIGGQSKTSATRSDL